MSTKCIESNLVSNNNKECFFIKNKYQKCMQEFNVSNSK